MRDYAKSMGVTVTGTNANPESLIDWFDYFDGATEPTNNYRFLSNFYIGEPVVMSLQVGSTVWKEREFQTTEHAFAAAKVDPAISQQFAQIADAAGPGAAKALGRSCTLRKDWEAMKDAVMAQCLRAKFAPDRVEAGWLVATGDALLVEGTWWGDAVWGVELDVVGTPGENRLGRMLMARRAELFWLGVDPIEIPDHAASKVPSSV